MAFVDYEGGATDGRLVEHRVTAPPSATGWRPPTGPAAGWYRDPRGLPGERYFDGRSWTDDFRGAFRTEPTPDAPTLDIRAAVGAALTLLVSLVGSRLLVEALLDQRWPIAAYTGISVTVGYGPSLVWCWWSSRRWGSGRLVRDLGMRPRWSDLGWGPLVWLCVLGAQIVMTLVIVGLDLPYTSNLEEIDGLVADRTYVVSLLVAAVVAAPFVEELIFRGVMLRGLRSRLSAPVAVVVQGVVFGLAHLDPARGSGNIGLIMVLSALGIVFGGAVQLLGRLPPAMIAHAIVNAIALIVVLNRF